MFTRTFSSYESFSPLTVKSFLELWHKVTLGQRLVRDVVLPSIRLFLLRKYFQVRISPRLRLTRGTFQGAQCRATSIHQLSVDENNWQRWAPLDDTNCDNFEYHVDASRRFIIENGHAVDDVVAGRRTSLLSHRAYFPRGNGEAEEKIDREGVSAACCTNLSFHVFWPGDHRLSRATGVRRKMITSPGQDRISFSQRERRR